MKNRLFEDHPIDRAVGRLRLGGIGVVWSLVLCSGVWGQFCGDSTCAAPETTCNCPFDCGPAAPAQTCNSTAPDDDCDGMVGCSDPNCTSISVPFIGSVTCASCPNGTCTGCERCGTCATCSFDCGSLPPSETNCADGMDNDCSGTADCADAQCLVACCGNGFCDAAESHCNCAVDCGSPPASEVSCLDGRDNDCDGDVDCLDSECFSQSACCGNGTCSPWEHACNCPADCGPRTASETVCDDFLDNDCDGFGDCGDADCFGQGAVCCGDGTCSSPEEDVCNCPGDCGPPPAENCNNTVDDDCDGMSACADYLDCSSVFGVSCNFGNTCGNGTCTPSERCGGTCPADCGSLPPSETNCADGLDNDCNGLADCAESLCLAACCGNGTCDPAENSCNCTADCGLPLSFEALCADERDSDCDGLADCADADCQGGSEADCTNGIDDDCDGDIDCADFDCCSVAVNCYGACTCCEDGTCDPAETRCSCPEDCGSPAGSEIPGMTCQDSLDNDCDGKADCSDTNCQVDADGDSFLAAPCGIDCDDNEPDAFPGAFETCVDFIDNECDGFTDCDDADCDGEPACCGDGNCDPFETCACPADCGVLTSEAGLCFDGVDNDCDGVPDCLDRDCCLTEFMCNQGGPGCGNLSCGSGENVCNCQCDCGYPPTVESECSNAADDDCDGLIDCYDPDCFGPDADGDGYRADLCEFDCDDTDASVHPNAAELCGNGIDNDCDGRVDCDDLADCAGDPACCDGDTVCESFESPCTCPGDCGASPASEAGLCFDGLDNDCDGVHDGDDPECCSTSPFGCRDGFCQVSQGENSCNCPCDCGAPPYAETVCGDGQDNDCDNQADCNDLDCQTRDADGDTYVTAPCGSDCNDGNAAIHPAAGEVCADGADNDCDGAIDCDDANCYGDQACEACCGIVSVGGFTLGLCFTDSVGTCGSFAGKGPGTYCQGQVLCCGFTSCTWDAACCSQSPGPGVSCADMPSTETSWTDGRDNNCDNQVDCADSECQFDVDGDGSLAPPCGDDCADANPCAVAGSSEDCTDGVDNDCDFAFDCADADCQVDADDDGFDALPCGDDCNDIDADISPGANELCADNLDNDCDGDADCDDPDCDADAACNPAPPALTSEAGGADKNRFISFIVPTAGAGLSTAVRVELDSLHHPAGPPNAPNFSGFEGQYRYVNAIRDGNNNAVFVCPDSAAAGTSYNCAVLGCTPEYRDWAGIFAGAVVHVTGNSVAPSSQYRVAQLASSCAGNEASCAAASAELTVRTERWGNVDGNPAGGAPSATDIGRVVDKVKDAFGAFIEPRCMLRDATPNPYGVAANAQDIGRAVDAVKGSPYPFTISACP